MSYTIYLLNTSEFSIVGGVYSLGVEEIDGMEFL